MSPLEKVPFATFYPLQKYLRGTCFFSKTTFSSGLIYWCSRVILCIQLYRLTQLLLSTLLKGIICKKCQSFTKHGHAKTPPTVFNPLSLWLTLPRDMGVRHTQWPHSITRAILACLWFVQGLYRVCTGFVQGTKKSKQQSNSPCCQLHLQRLYVYGAHVLTVPNHLYLTSATDGHVVNSVNSMNLGMMSSSVFVK